jgi:hypothetical protein
MDTNWYQGFTSIMGCSTLRLKCIEYDGSNIDITDLYIDMERLDALKSFNNVLIQKEEYPLVDQ